MGTLIPNPEFGAAAFSTTWWAVLIVLILSTVIFSGLNGLGALLISRALKKRDDADKIHNQRLKLLEEAVGELELKNLQQEHDHNTDLHKMELRILQCKQAQCQRQAQFVARDDHHGDILRLEKNQTDRMDRVLDIVTDLHRRVDAFLNEAARRANEHGR